MRLRYIILLLLLVLLPMKGLAADDQRTVKEFKADSVKAVELDKVPGGIEIVASTDGKARVILDGKGRFLEAVDVTLEGNVLRLKGNPVGGGATVVTSSGSVTNVIIGSGTSKVTVGGKTIETKSEPVELEVSLELPPGVDFRGEVIDKLKAELHIANIDLHASGVADVHMVALKSASLKADIDGSSSFFVAGLIDTDAFVKAAGASNVQLRGTFTRVEMRLSGASEGRTYGYIDGNLVVDLSGASDMEHNGVVTGKLQKSQSGASEFRIFN